MQLKNNKLRCGVIMPYGRKRYNNTEIDFDKLYIEIIKPAVEAEGLLCLIDYEQEQKGMIHVSTYNHVIYSDIIIADISTLSPSVLYQLGVRHATRRRSTIIIAEKGQQLPSDLDMVRILRYELEEGVLSMKAAIQLLNNIRTIIRQALESTVTDSPVLALTKELKAVDDEITAIAPMLFFNYARADKEKVEPVYRKLVENNYSPWMDERNLLPGENWEKEIFSTIGKCDFFMAFLSANSFDREGVLREELLAALKKWQSMNQDNIFLIPVLLEPGMLPDNLKNIQALNLYDSSEAEWLPKLEAAIKKGKEKMKNLQ